MCVCVFCLSACLYVHTCFWFIILRRASCVIPSDWRKVFQREGHFSWSLLALGEMFSFRVFVFKFKIKLWIKFSWVKVMDNVW